MTGVCAHTLQLLSHSPRGFHACDFVPGLSEQWYFQAGSAGVRSALSPAEDLLQQSPWCGNIPVLLPDVTQEVAQHCCQNVGKCQPLDPSLSTHWCAALSFLVLGLVPGLKTKTTVNLFDM